MKIVKEADIGEEFTSPKNKEAHYNKHIKTNKEFKYSEEEYEIKADSLSHVAEVKDYIMTDYEIAGYQKMIIKNWMGWDTAREKFNWFDTPYRKDYCVGVIFYK